ncbi:MAG TPA: amylo-alpha-1,6-glucosidase [Chloroflexota bacterium]|nr:amylo-alpha-1,6-glucosidase [Chloroflexota bacterium]
MLGDSVALKESELQFISDATGDIPADNPAGHGLYFRDTRFLSRYELFVNGVRPFFLSNSTNKHFIATFQFINNAMQLKNGQRVARQTVSIRRSRFVTGRGMFERIGVLNCNPFEIELDLVLAFDADFRDIFSVRGFKTQRVVGQITVQFGGEDVSFSYRGRDGVRRTTQVTFDRESEPISPHEVRFGIRLAPQQFDSIVVRIQPRVGHKWKPLPNDFEGELEGRAASYRKWDDASTRITTDNELFDREILRTSRYDVRALLEKTRHGLVPDAGVPWYAVPFGRDAIITSLQTLLYNPSIAEGTLRFLAAHQGTQVDEYKEEEPGKILHELRRGELARLGEVPHTPYYGTVDATPLFLVLFVETMAWLRSDALYRDLAPAALRALDWIDQFGDMDGDGYVEYRSRNAGGVVNQGWKDSSNSVQYEDGKNADQPLALVEVQGYVYQARVGMARLLRAHGDAATAERLERQAAELKARFNRDFWMEDEEFFALALDRDKQQVRSVTSNPGHCLWSGVCDNDKAIAVARRLLAPDMFSGWGVRTLSARSPNFNPMSYHNGSVWPHDNAIIAMGLRAIGEVGGAARLTEALIEAGSRFSDSRLPELFCGFPRDQRFNSSPTAYVVSCSPQAWAAGCIFMVIQAMLDLRPALAEGRMHVEPMLPPFFGRIELHRMRVGKRRIDLRIESRSGGPVVEIVGDELDRLTVPA